MSCVSQKYCITLQAKYFQFYKLYIMFRYQPDTIKYAPFDKQWIKVELFIQLGCQANQYQLTL